MKLPVPCFIDDNIEIQFKCNDPSSNHEATESKSALI